jgi:hypothetical protein
MPNITKRLPLATVFIEAVVEDRIAGEGSAFLIAVEPPGPTYAADFFLVTARHNVDGAIRRSAKIRVVFNTSAERRSVSYDVPAEAWVHSDHDVSVAFLDVDQLPHDIDAAALDSRAFNVNISTAAGAIHTLLYGRGRVGLDQPLLSRTASVMPFEQPRVHLEGVSSPVRVWLAEGIVSPGMSGGPAAATTGVTPGNQCVFGLIHGYAVDRRDKSAPYPIESDEVKNLRRELLLEINALRQHMIYIVPGSIVKEVIAQCMHQTYPGRMAPLGGTSLVP